ncbi:MAG: hypothetical protein ABIX01_08975 [Chitinophagaceae bacterium]
MLLNVKLLLSFGNFNFFLNELTQKLTILILVAGFTISGLCSRAEGLAKTSFISFFDDSIFLKSNSSIHELYAGSLSPEGIETFYQKLKSGSLQRVVQQLTQYKADHQLEDWIYYQLVRKTANSLCPKASDYNSYTLYKWVLLSQSGYDAVVRIIDNNRLLLYVQSNENVYNIPYQVSNGKQYVCLNFHDFDKIDLENEKAYSNNISIPGATKIFSYKITHLPDAIASQYTQKDLKFDYKSKSYDLKIKVNTQVKDLFINYPVVDYENYFNIPLSKETYASLIPDLKQALVKMSQKNGIDYLMHFTRYAFSFEKDIDNFGKEKRLSPEETLFYQYSDCEDRAGLFFYLVKEIYNLPMITLVYPEHVTIAVKLDNPKGKTILYRGEQYTVCEPTPQTDDLKVGQLPPSLRKSAYDIGYAYKPGQN